MRFNDALSGGFFILLAAAIFYMTKDFRLMPGQNYGAGFFPRTIASAMALFGTVLVVRGVRDTAPWVTCGDWLRSPRHLISFALIVVVLLFYILASNELGFLVTGFVSLIVLLLWLRGPGRWLEAISVSLGCVLVIQYFFGEVLRVPLPWGVLQPIAW